jgi:hypothetical protein
MKKHPVPQRLAGAAMAFVLALAPFALANLNCGAPPPLKEPEEWCGNGWCWNRSSCKCGEGCDCGSLIASPTDDKYNEPFALINALVKFFAPLHEKYLSEEQQKQKSDELKEIIVEAYSRNSYSAELPFTSEEIRKGLSITRFEFPYSNDTLYNVNIVLGTRTMGGYKNATAIVIHEIGHHWGFEENLAELLKCKYAGLSMKADDHDALNTALIYSPIHDNLLTEKVGDEKLWNVLCSQQPLEDYAALWNDNMIVTVDGKTVTLVSSYDVSVGRSLNWCLGIWSAGDWRNGLTEEFMKFMNFASVSNWEEEVRKMYPLFEKVIKTNNANAIKQVQDFFKSIIEFSRVSQYSDRIGSVRSLSAFHIDRHFYAIERWERKQCDVNPVNARNAQGVSMTR